MPEQQNFSVRFPHCLVEASQGPYSWVRRQLLSLGVEKLTDGGAEAKGWRPVKSCVVLGNVSRSEGFRAGPRPRPGPGNAVLNT